MWQAAQGCRLAKDVDVQRTMVKHEVGRDYCFRSTPAQDETTTIVLCFHFNAMPVKMTSGCEPTIQLLVLCIQRHSRTESCYQNACFHRPCSCRSSSLTDIRLMRFLVNSNAVKKMALTTHERLIETPRPGKQSGVSQKIIWAEKAYPGTFVD